MLRLDKPGRLNGEVGGRGRVERGISLLLSRAVCGQQADCR